MGTGKLYGWHAFFFLAFISGFVLRARCTPATAPTLAGLPLVSNGITPRPTQPPAQHLALFDAQAGNIPGLHRRQNTGYIFPPPENWCGLIEGEYSNPLSCNYGLTCVNSGAAIGCCSATTGRCTALYTTCANYADSCNAQCQLDPAVRKCDILRPYCGTYAFYGGTRLYNCQTLSLGIVTVEVLNDFYITAIGSTLASNTASFISNSATNTFTSTSSTPTADAEAADTVGSRDRKLGAGAIAGIVIGSVFALAVLAILVVLLCYLQRKSKKPHLKNNSTMPPPQIDINAPQIGPQAAPQPMTSPYVSGPNELSAESQLAPYPSTYGTNSLYPDSQPPTSAVSPLDGSFSERPESTVAPPSTSSQLPPQSIDPNSAVPLDNHRESYYIPPTSPEVNELDGSTIMQDLSSNTSEGNTKTIHPAPTTSEPIGELNGNTTVGQGGRSATQPNGPFELQACSLSFMTDDE